MTRPVLVDTTTSSHARLRPVPLDAVTLHDGFWAARLRQNREVILPSQFPILEETGRLDNFRRAAGRVAKPFQGYYYNDSDVYKWLEGAIWALATGDNPELAQQVETVVGLIVDAQAPDGYLNTYYTFERADQRWSNLRDKHELYCAGHLIQAAAAHKRVTGSDRLLDVARRFADLICETFGPERPGTSGHPEIEMALVELARVTGDARYLEQAAYFVAARGHDVIGGRAYHVDHAPFREMTRLTGHAVRAVYLCAGVADLVAETGDAGLQETLERLWDQMAAYQVYVTGGIGARHSGEAFGADYELPNARAYAETCAGIALVMWAWRMLALTGDAVYADMLERALYNAALPGISLDGFSYFYDNAFQDDGSRRRRSWYSCACCPTNIVRLLATAPAYLYATSETAIWVHGYAAGEVRLALPSVGAATLTQHTRYPWDGEVTLMVAGEGAFEVRLRIPGWCTGDAALEVNGAPWPGDLTPGTYVTLQRVWQPGDRIDLQLPMPVVAVAAHPYVLEDTGRVALMRGPLVYALEGVDHPGVDLRDVAVAQETFEATHAPDLLGGVTVLHGTGVVVPPAAAWSDRLYRPATPEPAPTGRPVDILAIPYYAWANRAPGQLQVWIKRPGP
ncbi:MAG: glycoside hydrolase family 127 protein [Anaerolineae bacterium]|nr:glycoside hydrolase family 127 protein [Anaerolineae bacterium]